MNATAYRPIHGIIRAGLDGVTMQMREGFRQALKSPDRQAPEHFIGRIYRDILNEALKADLAEILEKHKADLSASVAAALKAWIEQDASIENLADWLEHLKGWERVDGDKVESRLAGAAKAVREYMPQGEILSETVFSRIIIEAMPPHKSLVLAFSPTRKEAAAKPNPLDWLDPEIRKAFFPDPGQTLEIVFGLDALKIVFRNYDWLHVTPFVSAEACAAGRWLPLLAGPWLEERGERAGREAYAVGIVIRPKATTPAGNAWTPLPRALDVAAALGGPFAVDVDGETYAPEPGLAPDAVGRALRPRGLDIVPAEWLGNPAQLTLALDPAAPPEAVREYMIETAARTAHLAQLPNMCPKLLGFMFAAAPMTGRPVKGTLLELARWLYPDWKERRQNKRDLQGLGAAFVAVKSLRLVETKPDGTRHPYDLFTVDYDLSCKPDAVLGFMVNPWLAERMRKGKGGGFFLLNMSRWLALGIKDPGLFPLALRLAALWDNARVHNGPPDPARLRPIEADRLAFECNTLPEGAAMFKTGRTDARAAQLALTTARAKLESRLDALVKAGLLGPWEKRKVHGKGWTMLPMWPADYPEACKRAAQTVRKERPSRPTNGKG